MNPLAEQETGALGRPPLGDVFLDPLRGLEGGGERQLTDDPGYDSDARWSRNGDRIVFHSDRGAGEYHTQVYVMSLERGDPRPVTQGAAVNGYPSWSPRARAGSPCVPRGAALASNRTARGTTPGAHHHHRSAPQRP